MNDFHIVYRPENWDTHDSDQLANVTQQLAANNSIASARELESAAERFRPS